MADSASSALVAALLLVANVACAAVVGARIASRLSNDRLDRALIATLLVIVQAAGIPLVLAMLTVVSRVPLTIVHVALLLAVLRFVPAGERLPRGRLSV
ncbi:MAG: hypothetical protein WAT66_11220, partial [Actinomycetota bacterium]